MSKDESDSGSPLFCLVCNSSLEHLREGDNKAVEQIEEQSLVLVKTAPVPAGTSRKDADKDDEYEAEKGSPLSDSEWINRYQTFLAKTLHINFEDSAEDEEPNSKRLKTGEAKDDEVAMFCKGCKKYVERFYDAQEEVKNATKKFEELRDSVASVLVRTFIERKMQAEDISMEEESEEVLESTAEALLEKWRHIYTGEAEKEFKEKNLITEVREEAVAKNESRVKTEFPEGTGLSAMELAKMQRMMTACYFTPKMSIVRKKGKLFFRVGIPRTDKDKTYKCPQCENEIFQHQRSLSVHMRKHKARNQLRLVHNCHVCGEIFKDRRELIFHKKSQHVGSGPGPRIKYKRFQECYPCGICTCKFSSKAMRNAHLKKAHPNEKLYLCGSVPCTEVFTSEEQLKEHFESAHRGSTTRITVLNNNGELSEIFSCTECSKIFLKSKSLSEHMKTHSDPSLNECYYCGLGYATLESLQNHVDHVHVDPNPFNCDGCEEKFSTEELLIDHMKTPHHLKTFMCETCGKVSRSREAFKKHMLTHTATLFCDICSIQFSDSKALDTHMTKHVEKHPISCPICGDDELFKDIKYLRKHNVETHPETLKDTPEVCTICFLSFASDEELDDHKEKTHEKYKCDVCSRVFKLPDHLRRHQFIHTGEKPYQCTICNKSFNQESNLKEHLLRHSGVRPHRCPHCEDVAYLRRDQLRQHMFKVHGIGEDSTPRNCRAVQNPGIAESVSQVALGNPNPELKIFPLPVSLDAQTSMDPSQLLLVNDVTISDDGVHERIAPLIMKSLQNKSNQPIIVRRGVQVPQRSNSQYVAAIQIKSEGIPSDGQISEAVDDENETDPSQQQYVIYQL